MPRWTAALGTVLVAVLACGPVDTAAEIADGIFEDYYVDQDGDDTNDCRTWETACATITGVMDHVRADPHPSDFVHLSSGDHRLDVTVSVEPGLRPLIIGGEGPTSTRIIGASGFGSGSHLSLQQLRIDRSDADFDRVCLGTMEGGYLAISDVILENCDLSVVGESTAFVDRTRFADDSNLWNEGTTTVRESVFEGNPGGAIVNSGVLVVEDSTIDRSGVDSDAERAPAVLVHDGQVELIRSTVSRSPGVGIDILGGEISLLNSTLSGNQTGIHSLGAAVSLEHSTVAANEVGLNLVNSQAVFRNVIIAGVGANCTFAGSENEYLGVNLSHGRCPGFREADVLLGSLADNGGPTETHALLEGSAGIDAARSQCPEQDQRGVSRPVGAGCDVGAFEFAFELTAATPGGTPTNQAASFVTVTPGESSPRGRPSEPVACRLGPNDAYGVVRYVDVEDRLDLMARNGNASWLQVVLEGVAPCWSPGDKIEPETPGFDPMELPLGAWPPIPTETPKEGGLEGCLRPDANNNLVCTLPACGPNDPNGIPCTL